MSLVLSFGGPMMGPVHVALRLIAARVPYQILVLARTEEADLAYRDFSGTLDAALASMEDEQNGSVQLQASGDRSFLAGVYRPGFAGGTLADWSASAEGEGFDAEAAFAQLQSISGIGYLALSHDESPDFNEHVTEETFPWSEWRLVAGAVRGAGGAWGIRRVAR